MLLGWIRETELLLLQILHAHGDWMTHRQVIAASEGRIGLVTACVFLNNLADSGYVQHRFENEKERQVRLEQAGKWAEHVQFRMSYFQIAATGRTRLATMGQLSAPDCKPCFG
jgi:hypothetical protein